MQETHIHPNLLAVNQIPLYKVIPNTNYINSLNLNKLALGSRGQPKRTKEKQHCLILLEYNFESHTKFSLYPVEERTHKKILQWQQQEHILAFYVIKRLSNIY